MFYKTIAASLVATGLSVAAMAQPIQESDATQILDAYSSDFNALSINLCLDRNRVPLTGAALTEAFTLKQNEVVQLLNRGDKTMAAAKAGTMLNAFGHCYGKSDKQTDRPTYAQFMGGFIATDAMAYNNSAKMQDAIMLLDYAKSHSFENKQFLGLVKEYRVPELDTSNSLETTFSELQSEFDKNALRFKKKFSGKTVTFDVMVGDVAYENSVRKTNVSFSAPSGKLYGGCFVTGDMADKAIDLDRGQIISLTATPSVYESMMGSDLQFKNCQF